MDRACDMVHWLLSDAHRTPKEIATACEVKESTVSRWQTNEVTPNRTHLARLRDFVASVESEVALTSPWTLHVDRFKYICSKADSYSAAKDKAVAALSGVLDNLRRHALPKIGPDFLSLLIAPCPLEPSVDAHVFVAQVGKSAPMVSVILYRQDLGPEALREALITEINHLAGHAKASPVRLPPRKHFIEECGRKAP